MNISEFVPFAASLFLKGSVILAIAWAVSMMIRRRPAALRHLLWSLALGSVLALPIISPLVPAFELDATLFSRGVENNAMYGSPGPAAAHDVSPPSTTTARPSAEVEAVPARVVGAEEPGSRSDARGSSQILPILLIAWLWGTGALIVMFFVHLARIRAITSSGTVLEMAGPIAAGLARSIGLARPPRVLVSRVPSPMVWGLIRPVVLLPYAAAEWSADRMRAVLMHEFVHVRRWDYAAHVLGELACAVYWPNPFVWLARRRLQAEQEHACDDAVLQSGTPSHEYAEHLLGVSRALQGTVMLAAGMRMARRSGLKERIRMILDPRVERSSVTAASYALILVAIIVPALLAASLRTSGAEVDAASAAQDAETTSRSGGPDVAASDNDELERKRSEQAGAQDIDSTGTTPQAAASAAPFVMTIEAEAGHVRLPMATFEDDLATAGRFVMVPEEEGNRDGGGPGLASFSFEIPSNGEYSIWARVIGEEGDANSFFVSIDGGQEYRWDIEDADGDDVEHWTWLPVAGEHGVRFERGTREVTFRQRESGSKLDAIFVTDDPRLVPRGRSPLPPAADPFTVAFEAEHPVRFSAPLEIRTDDEASGRLYIGGADGAKSTDQAPENGRALYPFNVPQAGAYTVWARVIADDDDEDSFWVRMNGGAWMRWNGIAEDDDWRWRIVHQGDEGGDVMHFRLRAGRNALEIAYREDGARLDRILVTNDPRVSPERSERRSGVTVIVRK